MGGFQFTFDGRSPMACTSRCTAAVVPLPVNTTQSCSEARTALRTMPLASSLISVIWREVAAVAVCVLPYQGRTRWATNSSKQRRALRRTGVLVGRETAATASQLTCPRQCSQRTSLGAPGTGCIRTSVSNTHARCKADRNLHRPNAYQCLPVLAPKGP